METHIMERIAQRITDADARHAVYSLCQSKASRINDDASYAIVIGRMPEAQGRLTYDADGTGISNGNTLVLIVRGRRMVTAMWRRDTQPWTEYALRVNNLIGRM